MLSHTGSVYVRDGDNVDACPICVREGEGEDDDCDRAIYVATVLSCGVVWCGGYDDVTNWYVKRERTSWILLLTRLYYEYWSR